MIQIVRRRGIYEVEVIGNKVQCFFCKNTTFSHREVYMKVVNHIEDGPKKKLTFQSLTCEKCGQKQMFEERKVNGQSTIHYTEVTR